jgi:hypothetical protein
MGKRNWDFWDVVILIGALLILFWAILKLLGVINSPVGIDMLPYFGIGISILGFVYKLGKIMRGVEETERKVNKIATIENRFNKLENEHNLAMTGKLKIKH